MSKLEQQEYGVKLPKYIYVEDRTWAEWIMYFVYNLLRTVYVSLWFYFIPFVFLLGQYSVPMYFNPM